MDQASPHVAPCAGCEPVPDQAESVTDTGPGSVLTTSICVCNRAVLLSLKHQENVITSQNWSHIGNVRDGWSRNL